MSRMTADGAQLGGKFVNLAHEYKAFRRSIAPSLPWDPKSDKTDNTLPPTPNVIVVVSS